MAGATIMVCDKISLTGHAPFDVWGTRPAYGCTIEDIVIAQNTIDSNGGIFRNGVDDAVYGRVFYPLSCGIRLTRGWGFAGDGMKCGGLSATGAHDLRDRFLGIAIYNNIFSNNFALQIDLLDYARYRGGLDVSSTPSEDENVTPRPPSGTPEGIESFQYFALDYNAYWYRDDVKGRAGHRVWDEVYDSSGTRLKTSSGSYLSFEIVNDVRVATYRHFDDMVDDRPDRVTYRLAVDPNIYDELAFELNRVDINDCFNLYAPSDALQMALDFRWVYGRPLLYWYLASVGEDPWRTLDSSPVRYMGAHGAGTFPDETKSASGKLVYYTSGISDPEIDREFGELPSIGAYEP